MDLVKDLSTATFQRCLRKFAARRGTPSLIVSDNAKTFKKTEKFLHALFNHPEVRAELENQCIECPLNLERAPGWEGFFERLVGSKERCLRKVIGNARLMFHELLTALQEVEGLLNSRQLRNKSCLLDI